MRILWKRRKEARRDRFLQSFFPEIFFQSLGSSDGDLLFDVNGKTTRCSHTYASVVEKSGIVYFLPRKNIVIRFSYNINDYLEKVFR